MWELAWMALLKYFQLKSTSKQPLRGPNRELSTLSGISSANVCIGKLLNYMPWSGDAHTYVVARGPYTNLSPAQKFERKLLKLGQPAAMRSVAIV